MLRNGAQKKTSGTRQMAYAGGAPRLKVAVIVAVGRNAKGGSSPPRCRTLSEHRQGVNANRV